MAADNGSGEASCVGLSFLDEAESWQLSSHFFPSKVGGRPAWLALKHLPTGLTCAECNKPLTFLLQIYSPISDQADAFHRTVFVFFCKNNACYAPGKTPTFKALRSQLSRRNPYFPASAPDYDIGCEALRARLKAGTIPHVTRFASVCAACGCAGSQRCAKCRLLTYCCREHQVVDWKGRHKRECKELAEDPARHQPMLNFSKSELLLPEFALSEPQDEEEASDSEESESDESEEEEEEGKKAEEEKAKEKNGKIAGTSGELATLPDAELEAFARKESAEDKQFRHFKKIISKAPDQIIRYQRSGQPLWVSLQNQLDSPPPCERCGSPRHFEFQVMPQLLNSLQLDLKGAYSPDWGSLFVFSCAASCSAPEPTEYVEEFVWKQDIVQ